MSALPRQVSLPPVVYDAIINALKMAASTVPAAGQADLRTPAKWALAYYAANTATVEAFFSNVYLACWNQIPSFPASKYSSFASFMVALSYLKVGEMVAATIAVLATLATFSGSDLFTAGVQASIMPETLKQYVTFFIQSARRTSKISSKVCNISDPVCPIDVAKTLDYLNANPKS